MDQQQPGPIGFEGGPPQPAMPPQPGAPPGGGVPPPSYQAVAGTPLMKVDFPPQVLNPNGGMFSQPEYERFEVLMARANQWLMGNPGLIVIHVEGIETTRGHHNEPYADTESSVYIEYGDRYTIYTRSLRLWVRTRGGNDPPTPQQLGYFNVIPACLSSGGFLSYPEFESFDITINKINQYFRQQPIPGKIITLETEDIKMSAWKGTVDADKTHWSTWGDRGIFFINVIRIFYELGPPAMEEIGCADFVPSMTDSGGIFSFGHAQSLSVVAGQAHEWIKQQQGISISNIQTIDYKMSRSWGGGTLNTMRSSYYHRGSGTTVFMRIMRVCYTRSLSGAPPAPPPFMTYRTFTPHCLGSGGLFSMPQFTNQSSAVDIANAWLKATGAKVISAETVPVRTRSGGQYGDPEVTMTYDSGNMNEIIMFVVRVFLDGVYQDPPPEALPLPPAVMSASSANTECCTIL